MTSRTCAELKGRPCPCPTCAELGCFITRSLAAMRAKQADRAARRLAHRAAQPNAIAARPSKADRPRCGARTRSGGACQAPVVWDFGTGAPRHGRCRLHGGLSTGAKTPEGRERIAEAQRRRWRRLEEAALPPRNGEGVL